MTEHPIIAFIHPQLLKSNPLSQIVTSNPSLQPDTHFAVDMFPYKRTSFFRSPASNPKLRKSPEIRRFLELDFISLTSVLLSQLDFDCTTPTVAYFAAVKSSGFSFASIQTECLFNQFQCLQYGSAFIPDNHMKP